MGFPRPHELFLLGFEAAIWHFRGATTSFYWASKLPSGTFPAPLKSLKTLPAALPWDFPRPRELFLLAFEAAIWPFKGRHNFLLGFETAIWPFPAALQRLKTCKTSQQLCRETSRGAMCCFCSASKLLSGISEALQLVSIGLRNCHLARFQQTFNALKPSQQLCHGTSRGPTNCFCWASKLLSGPSVAPQLSIGLRNCHPPSSFAMGFPRPHELFLLGFEAAIWHFRGATTSFYWASKLPSGTFPAPLKSLKTLPAALPWDFPRPLELFLLAFEAAIWPFRGATTFY